MWHLDHIGCNERRQQVHNYPGSNDNNNYETCVNCQETWGYGCYLLCGLGTVTKLNLIVL